MGLRTGESHAAHKCHEVYYENMRREANDLVIIENVTEYCLKTVQDHLGPRYDCFSVCLDPRVFGFRTARSSDSVLLVPGDTS